MSVEHAASSSSRDVSATPSDGQATILLRQIAERSPVATIVVAAPDFRIVFANPAAHLAARCKPGELVGRPAGAAFGFIDPALLAADGPAEVLAVPDHHGDRQLWWDVSYTVLDTAATNTRAVLVTAVEVTRHHLARVQAQAAQETLDALLDYIPDGISITRGPDVHVERVSARGMALLGRAAADVTGQSALRRDDLWPVFRPGSDVPLPSHERPLARATRTGEVTTNETLIVRRPDGSALTLLCNSGPIRDAQGRVTGAVMAWHDVGELQRAQAALRDSEKRLRAVLLQIPAAIFILEAPDGRLTFQSRLLQEVLGDLENVENRAIDPRLGWAVHEDGSPYELMDYPSRRALFRGETVRAEPMLFMRPEGRMVNLEMYAAPVYGDSGEIVAAVAVAMDVTARRAAAARQAFLFGLQDSLRALSEPADILSTACTLLGRHLGAARICYGEMLPDDQSLLLATGYVDDAPSLSGVVSLARHGAHYEQEMRQGRTVVYEDAQADDCEAKTIGLELGTRAHVAVPRLREGRLSGSLSVTHFRSHVWSPADVKLIEDVAGRIWDAAERGRAETRLRASEERLRLALEYSGLGIWEYDVVSKTTIHSARHDQIFGYSEPLGEWSRERFENHIPESDRTLIEDGVRAALEKGDDLDIECRMIRTDGSQGWLNVRARPHYASDGRIVRLLGTIADITERKQAHEAVIRTSAKFESFAQTLPSMVWSSLPDGQIDWFNARVSEYSGIPESKLKPDGWAPVHADDIDRATRAWTEALASGRPFETEYRIRRHDGAYRWHITRSVPIRGAEGTIDLWIGASTDIEDQKSAEAALAQLNATLEQQVRERTEALLVAEAALRQSQKMEAVGQLTGGLAHDFNNLLTGITGSLELMATRVAQGKFGEIDRYLNVAQQAAHRAAALTHRLLAFSRRQTLDPKPTNIIKLVLGLDELIRRTVGPAVTVKVVGGEGLWPVLADPNQLENALLNLCINARDAMPHGGDLTIETRNQLLDELEAKALDLPAAEYVALSVSDTGCGMTEEVIARAFDPFFTTKPLGEGTGLGLSMVYGFARQSRGQARIFSELGRGTQVCLYLPRFHGDEEIVAPPERVQAAQRGEGQSILIVDDEPSVRTLVRDVLETLGYKVLEAENGAAGLNALQLAGPVDLLITDVGLPGGMNGRQLADAALVSRPELKILFITGYAETAVIGDSRLRAGMHIMTKPFSLETLGWRVREIISGTRQTQTPILGAGR